MLRWKFDELLERMGEENVHVPTLREMEEEIGIGYTTLLELKKNRQVGLDGRVLDMILTWASHKLGYALTEGDLLEFTLTEEAWQRPKSYKEWDCGIYRRKR